MIKTPKIFVTLRQAISLRFRSSAKFHFLHPSLTGGKTFKKSYSTHKNFNFVSVKSIIHSLRISIDRPQRL